MKKIKGILLSFSLIATALVVGIAKPAPCSVSSNAVAVQVTPSQAISAASPELEQDAELGVPFGKTQKNKPSNKSRDSFSKTLRKLNKASTYKTTVSNLQLQAARPVVLVCPCDVYVNYGLNIDSRQFPEHSQDETKPKSVVNSYGFSESYTLAIG